MTLGGKDKMVSTSDGRRGDDVVGEGFTHWVVDGLYDGIGRIARTMGMEFGAEIKVIGANDIPGSNGCRCVQSRLKGVG
jgi:hypothetical protein